MTWLAVALGGALGAVARFGAARWLTPPPAPDGTPGWPTATLAVNLAGSLLLGVLIGLATTERLGSPATRAFLTTGFCGALTTFSTLSVELVDLARSGQVGLAAAYALTSLAGGLVLAGAGWWAVWRATV